MTYETLVDGARGEAALAGVVRFVTGADAGAPTRPAHHELQQIHDGRCSHRVADWPKLRALLRDTRTAAACDELESLAAVFKNDTADSAAAAADGEGWIPPLVRRTIEMLSSCVRNKNLLKPTVRGVGPRPRAAPLGRRSPPRPRPLARSDPCHLPPPSPAPARHAPAPLEAAVPLPARALHGGHPHDRVREGPVH